MGAPLAATSFRPRRIAMPAKKKRVPTTPAAAAKKRPSATADTPQPAEGHAAPAKKLSALDAAALVLRAAGQPMSCPELIAQMAAKGYWSSPKGQTPASTLYAAIAREVKLKGAASRFVKAGPGRFAARSDARS
jgi:hypothetical protein